MDKDEKFELAPRKDIPFITRASILYRDSTPTRSLVLAIPGVGSSIDLILSKNGQDYVVNRIQVFLEELKVRLEAVEVSSINIRDEEAFFDIFQTAYESVMHTRSKEKIRRFSRLISDCLLNDRSWDETEATIRLISDLTDTHIQILKAATSTNVSTLKAFDGLRIISVTEKNKELDIPSLKHKLSHLSDAALKMYCSELISKGLLHDEGIGRWDTGSLELIVPTELADWLLDKIGEMDGA